jgi:hypothetical protein
LQMTSTARRHHYLPQAYLAAFTDTGTKDGRFYVLDSSGACFRTTPKSVAAERDFNRVDVEGKPIDIIEQEFATFEDSATQAIRNVNRMQTFPNDEDYNWIINLLCLIAVRNPQLRKSFNRSRELAIRVIEDLLVSDENIWATNLKKAQEAGYVGESSISFEEYKRSIKEGEYKIEFAPAGNLRVEFRVFDKILQLLGRRTWSLFVASSSGPDFICSDHPVALTWKNSANRGPIGYGLKNTEIFFPLGPKTGFYGVYEEPLSAIVHMNPAQVAMMNTRVAQSAERHVFSARETFFLSDKGEMIEVDCRFIFRQ